MKTIRIAIPEKEVQTLRQIAKRRKLSTRAVVRQAVRSFTTNDDWERAQEVGRRIAKRLGIQTEEDVTRVFD